MNKIVICIMFLFPFVINAQKIEYPQIYSQLQLPILPEATIVGLSRETEDIDNGIKVFLETGVTGMSLRNYYEEEMQKRGWTLLESEAIKRMRAIDMLHKLPFSAIFTKGDLEYRIFTSRVGETTKVHISLLRN